MKWISVKYKKPPINTPILIFSQGYDITGTHYWSHIEIGEYVLPSGYKKRYVFGTSISRYADGTLRDGFPLTNATHWMPLPGPPRLKTIVGRRIRDGNVPIEKIREAVKKAPPKRATAQQRQKVAFLSETTPAIRRDREGATGN